MDGFSHINIFFIKYIQKLKQYLAKDVNITEENKHKKKSESYFDRKLGRTFKVCAIRGDR